MTDSQRLFDPVVPAAGWHMLHLFYRVEHGQWQLLSDDEQRAAKTRLAELVQEIRAVADTQLLTLSIATPKADLGFVLTTPDLQTANAWEKRLGLSLGPDILTPVFSYLSLTELSEYTTTADDYAAETLRGERGLAPDSPEYAAALAEFQERMKHYGQWRLYPPLPAWPVVCFYPMSKRRGNTQNWYRLSYKERKELMAGHARIGRTWAGKIKQIISGSTGLDDAEWGVTLFSRSTEEIKGIVYEMRFDAVSAEYAEFGEFYIGLQLPLGELFNRLQL
ncbi:MAG: chlorite dismutase family protein [Verrucomicrobia bacterium]|nr:chlorite dismutase family protein [Verrucomicrobiota bacterium]